MKTRFALHLPFALILPAIQLLVAAFAITPELKIGMELQHRTHSVTLDGKLVPGQLNLNELVNIAIHVPKRTYPDRLHAISILNMPGILGEAVVDSRTTWPESWFPSSVFFADLWTWRALSWAIYTLPLWWMAGRAFDVLRSHKGIGLRRIGWVEMLIMTSIGVLTLVVGLGMFFNANGREDDDAINRWVIVPGLIWFGFGVCSLVAWRRQRRARRLAALAEG